MRNPSSRGDAQTIGRLILAANEAMPVLSSTSPAPQQVMDAVGQTLRLDAGGIFPTRGADDTPVALYFRNQRFRNAFVQGYRDHLLGVATVRQMKPAAQAIRLGDWHTRSALPTYLLDLLSLDSWVMSLEVQHANEVVALIWMFGSPKPRSKPPSGEVARVITQLTSLGLQETVGPVWAPGEAEELHLLEELGPTLTEERPLQERLNIVVERAQKATGFASIALSTRDPTNNAAFISALYVQDSGSVHDRSQATEQYLKWAAEYYSSEEYWQETGDFFQGREGPVLVPDPARLHTIEKPQRRWMVEEDVKFMALIPLLFGGEHLGTFRICSSFEEEKTWEQLRVFTALARHIAAILKSALLFVQVQEAHASLKASHHDTVRMLAYAVEARDPFTGDHLNHLEAYTRALGDKLGLPHAEAEELRFGAVLHDVGKLRIPDAVLLKPGKLDENEWGIIREHPLYGEDILAHSNIPPVALQIARWHHERWDGRGYPDGLRSDDIPLAVQIVTLADVFDALTSARPYKPAWPPDQAYEEIQANKGRQFAPQVTEAFESLWKEGTIQTVLASQIENSSQQRSAKQAA